MSDETSASDLPQGWAWATVADAAEVNPSTSFDVADKDLVSFVPMAAVAEMSNEVDATRLRPFGEVKKGYTRFQDGDVIFAKITPCMENGKVAVVHGAHGGRA